MLPQLLTKISCEQNRQRSEQLLSQAIAASDIMAYLLVQDDVAPNKREGGKLSARKQEFRECNRFTVLNKKFTDLVNDSTNPQQVLMRQFFAPKPAPTASPPQTTALPEDNTALIVDFQSFAALAHYESDESDDESAELDDERQIEVTAGLENEGLPFREKVETARLSGMAPLMKRRKLDVPYRESRRREKEKRVDILVDALDDLHKLLVSKRTKFISGPNGLQARRARAMESHLRLVIRNGLGWTEAAKQASIAHGFAANWGGRQLRGWNR